MPQWAGSCWYYLRFADPTNANLPWSKDAESYWLPVDLYVGGIEHAATHLLYSRFWHKVLYDLGHVSTTEPFERLVNQGMILGATFRPTDGRRDEAGKKIVLLPDQVDTVEKDDGNTEYFAKGEGYPVQIQWDKMSKSMGNVVNPDDVIKMYGADLHAHVRDVHGPAGAERAVADVGARRGASVPVPGSPARVRRRREAAGPRRGRGHAGPAEAPAQDHPRRH